MISRHTFLWRNIVKNRGKEVGVWSWVVHTASYSGLKEKRLPREKKQRRKERRNEPWKKRLGTFCFRDTCKKVRDYGSSKEYGTDIFLLALSWSVGCPLAGSDRRKKRQTSFVRTRSCHESRWDAVIKWWNAILRHNVFPSTGISDT
jgi:ribonuclease I